jgi:DNA-binding response OmpR family regulator
MARVMLVEDELPLARGILDNLRDEGHEVRHVERGDEALAAIEAFEPELLLLDIMLPACSGLDVLRELRAGGANTPVLMLTAKAEVVDRVVGLELGADDYLPKPFAVRELMARVAALLRRASPRVQPLREELSIGGLTIDFKGMRACRDGVSAELSAHDLLVLRVLVERRGEVVPRIDIVEEVCGLDSEATLRTVDNHVMALRRALGDEPREPRWLQTVRGQGYRLAADNE